MQVSKVFFTVAILLVVVSVTDAQKAKSPPAPPLAPDYVNLTDLLTIAGPFHTFLTYLQQTKVIETFQNQANNTDKGITIFVPRDKAFSSIKKPASLSNLTADQLKSLILFHALPHYYSLADFKNLSESGPVSTFAGGQYMLNFTDICGTVRISSGWSKTRLSGAVHSTAPVAIYQVDSVLLPETLFGPPPPPAPAPAPDYVNLTDLLTIAGPFHTFLTYLQQTKVIETFQNQANNTAEGITIFVPRDKAFSSIKKTASLSNLAADQLKSLILFHALPHYYSFADLVNLSESGPVSTFAGGQYMLNFTVNDIGGAVRMSSGWSKTKVSSSVHSTDPVAIYQVDSVLLPETLFGPPSPTPAPAPVLRLLLLVLSWMPRV